MSNQAAPPGLRRARPRGAGLLEPADRVRDEVFAQLRARAAAVAAQPARGPARRRSGRTTVPYWALVRYEDIRHASRNPDVFCSGQGTQFGDAPQELLEATQSFLAMDAPRHTKLRGLVSSAVHATPGAAHRGRDPRQPPSRSSPRPRRSAAATSSSSSPSACRCITISDMIGVPEADRERVVKRRRHARHRGRPRGLRRAPAARGPRRGDVHAARVRVRACAGAPAAPRRTT